MKKKRLLGKIVSLVLTAAMTVTMLPQDFVLTVRAAEETEAESETEAERIENEEEALDAESSEEESDTAKETETESATETESSTVKETETASETEEESSTAKETETEAEENTSEEIQDEDKKELQETIGNMNVNVHVYNGSDGGLEYDVVYLQYWQSDTAEVTNAEKEHFDEWNVDRYKLTDEGSDWYGFTIKGSVEGFQFLNSDGTRNTDSKGYESNMADYQGDLWYKNGAMYTDIDCSTRLTGFSADPPFLLVGTLPGMAWDETAEPNFVKAADSNKYSIELKSVPAGDYEYKILQNPEKNGWDKPWATSSDNIKYTLDATADLIISLDADDDTMKVDVQKTYVKDIVIDNFPKDIKKGVEVDLPKTATYYDGTGSKSDEIPVTYGVHADAVGVTITDGKLKIVDTYTEETVIVTATCEGFEKEFCINVVESIYKYTIYYYNPAYDIDTIDLWLWETNGAGATDGTPFTGTEILEDGNTWMKAQVELGFSDISIIPRIPGWSWQDETKSFINKDDVEEMTLYIIPDDKTVYTELPEIIEHEARYLIVEYIRNEGTAENWYFYTWNNGGTDFNPFVKTEDNRWIATVPVKWGLTSISYCIEKADMSTGEPVHWAEKDGNDYLCSMPVDQTIVKIVMEEGKGITKTYAYNKGYEIEPLAETIHFYYRDNNKFMQGNDGGYASVQVEVNGKAYDMTFDSEEQRYVYDMTGLQPGEYAYRYVLKETEESEIQYVLDNYNIEKKIENDIEYSLCKYEKFEVEVAASTLNPTMDYNDNNVLTVEFKAKGEADITGMEADHATADLSELGGSSDVAIDTELLKLTIAVREGISSGEKTIPVTVYDQYKNEYKTEAKVTVTDRDKSGDFDWDEAIIYFAVTDRFFDGNTANNANVDKNGPSSYHGGDFAGLTQKLDYLKDLGVNTIWITPIVENAMDEGLATDIEGITSWGYHGYWASNFEKIDSHLGTEEEFQALLNEAHKRGIKIMVDVVLNHSGYGEATKKYFNETFKDKDGNPIRMLRESDEMVSGSDQMTSLSGLPDFLTENSEVRELLVEWQSKWISKYDIDYYRIDTVKHVDDTTWSAFKNALTAINPDFKMIGEWAGGGYATDTGMLGTGRMDSLLDFDFNDQAQSFANGNLSSVENFLLGRNAALNNTATVGQFMSSHDEDGLLEKLISENKISEERATELFKVAASLQITAKGQPVIYYGEEVGQYGANNYPYQTNRYDFDWSRVDDDNAMLTHYKKLLAIRNQYSEVFAKGSRSTVDVNNEKQYDIFARSYGDTAIYVGLSNAEEAQSVTFNAPAAVYQDLYSGEYYNTDEKGKLTVEIPAAADGGTVVLLKTEYGAGNLWVGTIPDQTYTGSAIKLDAKSLVVRFGGRKLEAGKDYTVTYKDNKNVSTDSTKASVTIKGKGNFTEQKTVEFNIVKKNLDSADVVLTCNDMLAYNANKEQNAAPKLKYGKLTLKANKEYTTTYYKKADYESNPVEAAKLLSIKDAGSYVMVITAVESSNYTGSIERDITITDKTVIKGASVTLSASSVSYVDCCDEQKRPQVTQVKVKGKIIDSEAYDVTYKWNGEVGTAAAVVTIKADNENYIGSVEKTFKVTGEKLGGVAVVDSESIKSIDYDKAIAETTAGMTQSAPALKEKTANAGYSFEEGKDYTVSYKNNKKAGKATVIFTGKGRYTGTISAAFQINAKTIQESDADLNLICAEEAPYSKAGSTPAVTVRYGGKLLGKNDYSISYKDNKNPTDTAKAVVTFKGNYKGTATKTFKIVKQNLENTVITVKDVMYNTKPGKAFAVPTVKESNGKALKAGTDYDRAYTYTYVNETTVKNAGQDVVRVSGDEVNKDDIIPENTLIKVTVNAVENGNYTGSKSAVYNVMNTNLTKAKIKIADKEYTGYQVRLNEEDFTEFKLNGSLYTVKLDGNKASLTGTDGTLADGGFEIVSYDKNINKGTAKVTLKGTGNFGGTVTKTFKIKANNVKENWFQMLARLFSGK